MENIVRDFVEAALSKSTIPLVETLSPRLIRPPVWAKLALLIVEAKVLVPASARVRAWAPVTAPLTV